MTSFTSGSARFEPLHAAAFLNDLPALTSLSTDDRHAVMLGGLSAACLSAEHLEAELAQMLSDGCDYVFAEDVLIQMGIYIGYPAARQCLACLAAAGSVSGTDAGDRRPPLPDRSAEERFRDGIAAYGALNPDAYATITSAFGALAGDVIDRTFRSFGDLYSHSALPLPLRQLATVTCLAVQGSAAPQLRFHLGAALHVGVAPEKLVGIIAWVQFFKGAPAAYNAMTELKAALAAGGGATPDYS